MSETLLVLVPDLRDLLFELDERYTDRRWLTGRSPECRPFLVIIGREHTDPEKVFGLRALCRHFKSVPALAILRLPQGRLSCVNGFCRLVREQDRDVRITRVGEGRYRHLVSLIRDALKEAPRRRATLEATAHQAAHRA